jgi:hypothetical protein
LEPGASGYLIDRSERMAVPRPLPRAIPIGQDELESEEITMAVPTGLNHVAMSVAPGTLTAEWRTELLEFYGAVLGWSEIESLRLPDRLTILVGRYSYLNVRERAEPMTCSGYEHLGIVVASSSDAREIWHRLDADSRELSLEPYNTDDQGSESFRFRYMLPLAVEIQYFS